MRFDTLLIANRGEIACRVIRTARRLGLRTVAVFSSDDAQARHVAEADIAVPIGAAPAAQSYLRIEALLDACRASGATAVHPGYGFLSENPAFSRACRDAGIVFVGPSPEATEALGNKSAAKAIAQRVGVPCLPGFEGRNAGVDVLTREAQRIGTPLMIKAAAGGGGRGMRRVDALDDLPAQLEAASNEARAAFGSGELLLERLLEDARHVEVQVFGDEHGNYLHLGERDCSTQRRNQKVLEEAPAPGVDEGLRSALGDAAILLAREVGYCGAGTVEFLLAPDGQFYFLEMNTRLQVEHPVTEAITGLDLVELQLDIAQGRALSLSQDEVRLHGHSIEARLCAEDAFNGFVPQSGPIAAWTLPPGSQVRIDHGLAESASVSRHYDSMIAKIIATGRDRDESRRKLIAALQAASIHGVLTNRDFLLRCLRSSEFRDAKLSTRWLDNALALGWEPPAPDSRWLATAAALLVESRCAGHGVLAGWSSVAPKTVPLALEVDTTLHPVSLRVDRGIYTVGVADAEHTVEILAANAVAIDGQRVPIDALVFSSTSASLDMAGFVARFEDTSARPPAREDAGRSGEIFARMHGQVVGLGDGIDVGAIVSRGARLLSLEAMKMEHRIDAPLDGRVAELRVAVGTQVQPGQLMIRIEPLETPSQPS
ncbi:MAG: biotin/lipoyl-binding protein [Burkholderiaceae bacterium]|nr:biotin/lipoyl-binding protein [Burkholderiaceae bacterium]